MERTKWKKYYTEFLMAMTIQDRYYTGYNHNENDEEPQFSTQPPEDSPCREKETESPVLFSAQDDIHHHKQLTERWWSTQQLEKRSFVSIAHRFKFGPKCTKIETKYHTTYEPS